LLVSLMMQLLFFHRFTYSVVSWQAIYANTPFWATLSFIVMVIRANDHLFGWEFSAALTYAYANDLFWAELMTFLRKLY
jgi:hypothetical protein